MWNTQKIIFTPTNEDPLAVTVYWQPSIEKFHQVYHNEWCDLYADNIGKVYDVYRSLNKQYNLPESPFKKYTKSLQNISRENARAQDE